VSGPHAESGHEPEPVEPTLYEWRRPDGTLLLRWIFGDWRVPPIWPFDVRTGDVPVGPVQVFRTVGHGQRELIAETTDGPTGLVVYRGGIGMSFMPERNP
jgi:hypothetical protein